MGGATKIDESTIFDALGQTMLFGALDDDVLRTLAKACHAKSHDKASMVVVAGDPGGTIMVVASGRLKVVSRSSEGADIVLSYAVPGDTLGELSIFDLEPRAATIEATQASVVITVPHDIAVALIRDHPDLAEEVMRQQAIMIRKATGQLSDLAFLDLPHRVAKYIQGRAGNSNTADLGLSQTELAAAVGAVRQTVNSALKGFERRGWIKADGRIVEILDRDALDTYIAAGR